MFNLTNKTAAITGAASGIGRAIAMLFAKQDATIHIIDFNLAAAELVVAEINAIGGNAYAHAADVSDQNAMINIFEKIGTLDILVNNAGIAHVGSIETTSSADFDKVFRVNVQGAYNAMFAAIPAIKSNGKGVILNLASIAALIGIPDRFAYSMSKGLSAPKHSL